MRFEFLIRNAISLSQFLACHDELFFAGMNFFIFFVRMKFYEQTSTTEKKILIRLATKKKKSWKSKNVFQIELGGRIELQSLERKQRLNFSSELWTFGERHLQNYFLIFFLVFELQNTWDMSVNAPFLKFEKCKNEVLALTSKVRCKQFMAFTKVLELLRTTM